MSNPPNGSIRTLFRLSLLALLLLFGSLCVPAFAQETPFDEPSTAEEEEAASADDSSDEALAVEGFEEGSARGMTPAGESEGTGLGASMPTASDVRDGAAASWNDYLVPVWTRFSEVLPSVLKAIGLLVLFWIAAVIASWLVSRLLSMTELDNRLARDLGMEERMVEWEKRGTSLEQMAGTAVKWIVLLFGFVAFFNALQLNMVAGPLENILNSVSSALTSLLQAFAFLALYWVVATLLRLAISRGLKAVGFDERAGRFLKSREVKGELVGPSDMVGRLVFYVVLLFGLPTFLEALGQEAAVAPLRDMITEFFAFLPNVVAALILIFIARVVATIVREIVTNFLAAAGADAFAQRFGLGTSENSRKLSDIVGAVAYFFVMIPLIVAAVDSLQIEAISDPVKTTLQQVLAAIPLIIVAFLVMAVGYLVARTVRGLVESFLRGVGFDTLPEKVGLTFLMPKEGSQRLSTIAGSVVMVIILLLTAQQALASLELEQFSELLGGLIAYLPQLAVGVFVILAALSLGNYVSGLVGNLTSGSGHGNIAALVTRYAIYFLGFSMGLNQLGVGEEIIRIAVSAVLGGAALALGIALGLGGRERAKEFVDGFGRSSG